MNILKLLALIVLIMSSCSHSVQATPASGCPAGYTLLDTTRDTRIDISKYPVLRVSAEDNLLSVMLSWRTVGVQNYIPEPGRETVMTYTYNNAVYVITIRNTSGIFCFLQQDMPMTDITESIGLYHVEQTGDTKLLEFIATPVALRRVGDDGIELVVDDTLVAGRVPIPETGMQVTIDFSYYGDVYHIYLVHNSEYLLYKVKFPGGKKIGIPI